MTFLATTTKIDLTFDPAASLATYPWLTATKVANVNLDPRSGPVVSRSYAAWSLGNLASRSKVERRTMAPASAVLAVAALIVAAS